MNTGERELRPPGSSRTEHWSPKTSPNLETSKQSLTNDSNWPEGVESVCRCVLLLRSNWQEQHSGRCATCSVVVCESATLDASVQ